MSTAEGSLDAPTRHIIDWQNPEFVDPDKIDAELRRVFDVCHGCRRCFNLCDSFPRLFDLIDDSESGELETVESKDFQPVIDACTLCDMCFMVKCPYVPPHEFDLDFPHLMLRARVAEFQRGEVGFIDRKIAETDANGKLSTTFSPLANWACKKGNGLTRPVMEAVAGIDAKAELPEFNPRSLVAQAKADPLKANPDAPAHGRKAVIYATCFTNWNDAAIGEAGRRVLAHNGVETEVVHPACCGMPKLELGDLAEVTKRAKTVAAALLPYVDQGYDVVALVPSCALMMKFEWPLIVPDDPDVKRLAEATRDISEYVIELSKNEGLVEGMATLDVPVTLHIACHARAQNMGAKAAEMLRMIPETKVNVIERCSGHGGAWGIKKGTFEIGMKVGKPVVRNTAKHDPEGAGYVVSECPLAGIHIRQGVEEMDGRDTPPPAAAHPIQLIARAYGLPGA
ncbi:MAG: glycerol-3-phosphate dehydrogenase [Rhodospirillaceae bacterium]|jgi:glycerol-3-phosphate dehydrogenase subunit C|nr:glycerol-3-phosphate dehydrogenase [Rhodospirillaceae bacterium]MBT6512184.1 glycerol-3-phosphate dehydrogenase [Rhodospirillaceae bacterium]MBT7615002.1 glycerol-3-phosphate dehydrogenase [Rhodospirillaceae bacterium]MBT7648634.1 glycerol-3-phosphate dehydrogenase [Rhodospirillaceae bacterium]